LLLFEAVVTVASQRHLNFDDEVLALAETKLADLNVDVGTRSTNDGTGSAADLANLEPARLGDLDVKTDVGGSDGEDTADATSESVAKIVCEGSSVSKG
jgi:hypothetical protein